MSTAPGPVQRWFPWACLGEFVTLSTLAILRHVTFHARVFDLGIFQNVLWNTSRLHAFETALRAPSYLGDHFSPALGLLAPLEWLPFPVAAILVAQAAAAVWTAISIEALARRHMPPRAAAWIGACCLLHPALFGPALADFHTELFLAAVLARALLVLDRGRPWGALAWLLVGLATKEDAGLLVAALGVSLALARPTRRFGVVVALAAVAWSTVVVFAVMPHFRPPEQPGSLYVSRYAHLGADPAGVVRNLVLHPFAALGDSFAPYKLRTLALMFLGFALAPLFAPRRLLASLPTLLLHYLSSWKFQFLTQTQYLAPLVPVLGWAAVDAERGPLVRWPRLAPALALLVSAAFSIGPVVMHPDLFLPRPNHAALVAAVAAVPDDAEVCVPAILGAHLAARRRFELCIDGTGSSAPFQVFDLENDRNRSEPRIAELRAAGARVAYEGDGVIVLFGAGVGPP